VYRVTDLPFLTFEYDGQTHTVETCEASFFDAYIDGCVEVVNVERETWPLPHRRKVINVMAKHAAAHGYEFPFQYTKLASKKE
jgi:hypothetical protein